MRSSSAVHPPEVLKSAVIGQDPRCGKPVDGLSCRGSSAVAPLAVLVFGAAAAGKNHRGATACRRMRNRFSTGALHARSACSWRTARDRGTFTGEGFLDLAAGVQHGAVVAAAEVGADLLQRQAGQLAGEVHADLARQQGAAPAAAATASAAAQPGNSGRRAGRCAPRWAGRPRLRRGSARRPRPPTAGRRPCRASVSSRPRAPSSCRALPARFSASQASTAGSNLKPRPAARLSRKASRLGGASATGRPPGRWRVGWSAASAGASTGPARPTP